MGTTVLRDVLARLDDYEPDDVVYLPVGSEATLDTNVVVERFDVDAPYAPVGHQYFLGVGDMRESLAGTAEEAGRALTLTEKLRVIAYYAEYDAHIDLNDALDK
jgi:hypothetical protein